LGRSKAWDGDFLLGIDALVRIEREILVPTFAGIAGDNQVERIAERFKRLGFDSIVERPIVVEYNRHPTIA